MIGMDLPIKQDYGSPRWSGEICDCSMPLTFDTYSGCSYNCLYCFAYFQKSHTTNGYKGKSNPKDGKSPYKYFEGILYPIGLDEENNVIYKYNTKKARS